jgi:hypothetical protein
LSRAGQIRNRHFSILESESKMKGLTISQLSALRQVVHRSGLGSSDYRQS